jgi:Flp pilus assembly pilin Flp
MRRFKKRKFWRNRRGQGLTEYAMLIALVSLALVLLLGRFRNAIGNTVKNSTTAMNAVSNIQQEQGNAATAGGPSGLGSFLNSLVGAATAGLNAASTSLAGTGAPASPISTGLAGLANLISGILGNF